MLYACVKDAATVLKLFFAFDNSHRTQMTRMSMIKLRFFYCIAKKATCGQPGPDRDYSLKEKTHPGIRPNKRPNKNPKGTT